MAIILGVSKLLKSLENSVIFLGVRTSLKTWEISTICLGVNTLLKWENLFDFVFMLHASTSKCPRRERLPAISRPWHNGKIIITISSANVLLYLFSSIFERELPL